MCGIVGGIAERNVIPILAEGLHRLEYRGYDSAGIGALGLDQEFIRVRSVGKVAELDHKLKEKPIHAKIGMAHTRWATHGKPTEANTHPHIVGDIMLVHNGILENYTELKQQLMQEGHVFHSETDTEVIAHILNKMLAKHQDMLTAIHLMRQELSGAFALLIMQRQCRDKFWLIRQGSPLVIGVGIGENFAASDTLSLLPVTRKFIYLEEGDCAAITRTSINIIDAQGKAAQRSIEELDANDDAALKGHYKHFMQKEIFEQPRVVSNILSQYLDHHESLAPDIFGADAKTLFEAVRHIKIIACGTSFYAGLVAKYWLEGLAHISTDVEIASEYRYRDAVVPPNTLLIVISQSGETADTLAALRLSKAQNYLARLAICNVATSTLVREAELSILSCAGKEVGVAATKSFTAQLTALYLLTGVLAQQSAVPELISLPTMLNHVLALDQEMKAWANDFKHAAHALFLGRGIHYPIALEGALKLKEISYIHAEAYPAGELKHGPLALIDEHMPVVVLVPHELSDKLKANIEEVAARCGQLYLLVDQQLVQKSHWPGKVIAMPEAAEAISPIIYTLPLQLLAYYVAVLRGTDVDQPRNLAKSVTVE